MENVPCLLCGASNEFAILRREKPRHVICRDCGLVYQNPRPSLAELAAYYQEGYWEDRDWPEEMQMISDVAQQRSASICEWTAGEIPPDGLIVEVGCGPGEILHRVSQQLQRPAIGIEPSQSQAESARRRFGLEVINSGLEGANLGDKKASLLILSHVVEHFHEPVKQLEYCRSLLTDAGMIYIEVPNILYPHPRKDLRNWFSVEHVYYYSPDSLSAMLRMAGLKVVWEQNDVAVRVLAKKSTDSLEPPRLSEFWAVRRAIWKHDLKYWPWRVALKLRLLR